MEYTEPTLGKDGFYHYIYRIENLVNGKYYKGMHSTNNLNDNYLGSGVLLKKAKEKYGKDNFKKEIIKFFESRDEALDAEFEYISEEDIASDECYNVAHGGKEGSMGRVTVEDENGHYLSVDINDERLKSGELIYMTTGKVVVKNKNGETI